MTRRGYNPVLVASTMIAVVAAVGAGVSYLPRSGSVPAQATATPPLSDPDALFTREFMEGVKLLREGHAAEALAMFQSARKRRPHSAALWTNIGFAMLANSENAVAAFETALTINARQINAYYGLAMALEAQGEMEGALGAMRTYLHLAPKGTDFYRMASSAVWEWEEDRKAEPRDLEVDP